MEEILHQLRLVASPIIYKVLWIPGGAGFQPSTVRVSYHPIYNDRLGAHLAPSPIIHPFNRGPPHIKSRRVRILFVAPSHRPSQNGFGLKLGEERNTNLAKTRNTLRGKRSFKIVNLYIYICTYHITITYSIFREIFLNLYAIWKYKREREIQYGNIRERERILILGEYSKNSKASSLANQALRLISGSDSLSEGSFRKIL